MTLVSGPVALQSPNFVNCVKVVSAKDMYEAVMSKADETDIIIMAAAVADYTSPVVADSKIKKKDQDMSISLARTKDILATLGEKKHEKQFLCGFSMETDNLLDNSSAKLVKKNADMIVANSLRDAGAGFGTDTNIVTLITRDGAETLPIMSKDKVSAKILEDIVKRMN